MSVTPSPAEIASQIFRNSPYQPLRLLKCRFENGILTLSGCVPSFYLKQVAQVAVCGIAGVAQVENLIEVAAG